MYQATGPDGKRQHTVAEIAQTVGVHRTTVYDYLKRRADIASDPQDAPGTPGRPSARLLRRNIAIDAERPACPRRRPPNFSRRALPATTPTPTRPRRRQRAAVLTRHRRRDGRESRHE